LNAGGLRADIPAGELTYGQVYEVLPFDNNVAMLTLNGDELLRLLRTAYGNRRGVLQISGIKVQLTRCRGLNRLRSATLDNGTPILPDRMYRVALTDFMARGGDGLNSVLSSFPKDQIDLGDTRELNIRDALIAFWQRKGADLRPPAVGRVTVLDDPNGCETGPRAKEP
jgi:5'-nucleotidase